MYEFHCNYIKKKFGSKAKLLFAVTDSLTYEIEAKYVYSLQIGLLAKFGLWSFSVINASLLAVVSTLSSILSFVAIFLPFCRT